MIKLGDPTALAVFGSITALIVLTYFATRRNIGLLEIIPTWCFIVAIQNQYIWFAGLNLKLFEFSQDWANFLAYDNIRAVIVPLSMLFYLEWDKFVRRLAWRAVLWVGAISAFVGIESLAESLNVLAYGDKWTIWWSVIGWTIIVTLSLAFIRIVRRIAHKDVTT